MVCCIKLKHLRIGRDRAIGSDISWALLFGVLSLKYNIRLSGHSCVSVFVCK
jgi:hypothetical protein